MEQVLQLLEYIIQVLEQAPGEWLLVCIVVAFFLGRHGGEVDNWITDVTTIIVSSIVAVVVEDLIRGVDIIARPLALAPEAPTPPLVSGFVFVVIFFVIFFLLSWLLGH